jgi:predicted NBD/HSP70 family sugar kinase
MTTALQMQAADQGGMRRNNLALVLRLLHDKGPRSRAAVAVETGLNKATVSSLVAELIDRGLVREVGTSTERNGDAPRLGRPPTLLEIDGRNVACVGIEVNVDVIEVVVTDLAGRRVFEHVRPLDAAGHPPSRTMGSLTAVTRHALDAVHDRCPTVAGISVAVPGLIHAGDRAITFAPNLHWRDVDLGVRLATDLGINVPISIDNDANLSGLAEYRVGEFAGTPNLITVTGQTGVGGGIVVEGRLLRGASGFGGEVGHMHVLPDGPECGCGRRGCWEALVGLKSLLRRAVPDLAATLEADDSLGPDDKVARVVTRAQSSDAVTLAALHEHGRWLGDGVSILVNLFDPEAVVLGGFFRDIAPWVLPIADARLRELAIAPHARQCRLAASTLAFSSAALGGALHAAERVFDDPAVIDVRRT